MLDPLPSDQLTDILARLASVRWSWDLAGVDELATQLGWPAEPSAVPGLVHLRTKCPPPAEWAVAHGAGPTPRQEVTVWLTGFEPDWAAPERTDRFAAAARVGRHLLGAPAFRLAGRCPELAWPVPGGVLGISDYGHGLAASLESSRYVAYLAAERDRTERHAREGLDQDDVEFDDDYEWMCRRLSIAPSPADLRGRAFRNLLRGLENRLERDLDALGIVAEFEDRTPFRRGPVVGWRVAIETDPAVHAGRQLIGERLGVTEPDLVVTDLDDRLPLLAFDDSADQLIALQPGPIEGTRHRRPDRSHVERGSAAFLSDLLARDQRVHDALQAHPAVLGGLHRALARGTLTVDYQLLIVEGDQVRTQSLGVTGMDGSGLAGDLPPVLD